MQAFLLLSAAAIPAPPPPTPDEAIALQQAFVRDAAINPCRRAETQEEIVVCGRPDRTVPERRTGRGYDPSREFEAPVEGPWFSLNRGPLSITCCAVRGSQSRGAGLGLRLRF